MEASSVAKAFGKKVRRGIFNPVLRYLPEHVAEDRLQEAICMTYEMVLRYAARGAELPDAILVHSCRQRATDAGRRFVSTDSQPRKDVLDPRHQLERRFEVLALDGLPRDDGDLPPSDGDQEVGLRAALQRDPTRDILSALSLEEWLNRLSERDQTIVAMRAAGYTLGEIADAAEKPVWFVFKRLGELGRDLAEHAGIVLVRKQRKARRSGSA